MASSAQLALIRIRVSPHQGVGLSDMCSTRAASGSFLPFACCPALDFTGQVSGLVGGLELPELLGKSGADAWPVPELDLDSSRTLKNFNEAAETLKGMGARLVNRPPRPLFALSAPPAPHRAQRAREASHRATQVGSLRRVGPSRTGSWWGVPWRARGPLHCRSAEPRACRRERGVGVVRAGQAAEPS